MIKLMFKSFHEPSSVHKEMSVGNNKLSRSNTLNRSILLVDDEPQTLDLLRLMLKRDGYDVYEADGGKAALEKVKNLQPDLVLLDVMMPDIDGIEVCEDIRADRETADIPVVMLSARTYQAAVEKGILAGATRYLAKPISRADLLRHVREVLDGVPSIEVQSIRRNLQARGIMVN